METSLHLTGSSRVRRSHHLGISRKFLLLILTKINRYIILILKIVFAVVCVHPLLIILSDLLSLHTGLNVLSKGGIIGTASL
jgi:hypothetical protein